MKQLLCNLDINRWKWIEQAVYKFEKQYFIESIEIGRVEEIFGDSVENKIKQIRDFYNINNKQNRSKIEKLDISIYNQQELLEHSEERSVIIEKNIKYLNELIVDLQGKIDLLNSIKITIKDIPNLKTKNPIKSAEIIEKEANDIIDKFKYECEESVKEFQRRVRSLCEDMRVTYTHINYEFNYEKIAENKSWSRKVLYSKKKHRQDVEKYNNFLNELSYMNEIKLQVVEDEVKSPVIEIVKGMMNGHIRRINILEEEKYSENEIKKKQGELLKESKSSREYAQEELKKNIERITQFDKLLRMELKKELMFLLGRLKDTKESSTNKWLYHQHMNILINYAERNNII